MRGDLVAPLLKGIASHHAGCLPGWKALIEDLFLRGMPQYPTPCMWLSALLASLSARCIMQIVQRVSHFHPSVHDDSDVSLGGMQGT